MHKLICMIDADTIISFGFGSGLIIGYPPATFLSHFLSDALD
jgi:hypothetical protein